MPEVETLPEAKKRLFRKGEYPIAKGSVSSKLIFRVFQGLHSRYS